MITCIGNDNRREPENELHCVTLTRLLIKGLISFFNYYITHDHHLIHCYKFFCLQYRNWMGRKQSKIKIQDNSAFKKNSVIHHIGVGLFGSLDIGPTVAQNVISAIGLNPFGDVCPTMIMFLVFYQNENEEVPNSLSSSQSKREKALLRFQAGVH